MSSFDMSSFAPEEESLSVPLPSLKRQIHTNVCVMEVPTDIVCTAYSDRIFVVITQINKFGTLIQAEAETKADGGKIYQISTLMGKRDDPLLHIYARQIIERIAEHCNKPLLLCISLQPECRDTTSFQTILNHLYEHMSFE